MASRTLLINASNLHVGGGVAVATSFICHLSASIHASKTLIVVSSAVDLNIRSLGVDRGAFKAYLVHNSYFVNSIATFFLLRKLSSPAAFTIFGPVYFPFPCRFHIMGLADPYLIYPDNEYLCLSATCLDRLYFRFYIWLKLLFISRNHRIVFETPSAESSFRSIRPSIKSHVVSSGYHDIHLDSALWQSIAFPEIPPGIITLGLISKLYPHKDLQIIPAILEILNRKLGLPSVFLCTLNHCEYRKSNFHLSEYIVNIGPLSLAQCPTFYNRLDGVLFPTLLESYSAVIPESFVHQKPLFISDIPSLRDVAGDYAFYFQPHDPNSAALAVYSYYISQISMHSKDYRLNIPPSAMKPASSRSNSYISLFTSMGLL